MRRVVESGEQAIGAAAMTDSIGKSYTNMRSAMMPSDRKTPSAVRRSF